MGKKPLVLIILDGLGVGERTEVNAIHVADPPYLKYLEENYPYGALEASGISVGLPWGEPGSSEVGHMTLGSGVVIYQNYPRISMSIRDGSFFENPVLKKIFTQARFGTHRIHLIGLLSYSNNESSLEHLRAVLEMAEREKFEDPLFLHLIADGMGSKPKTLPSLLKEVPREKLATLIGRTFALDHEGSWNKTRTAYEALTQDGPLEQNLEARLENFFKLSPTEENLPPLRILPDSRIKEGDCVLFFNFREDTSKQLLEALGEDSFGFFPRTNHPKTNIFTMTRYGEKYSFPTIFPPQKPTGGLAKVLAENGKSQFRIAESEKYAHVTYYFNSMREEPYDGEFRVAIPAATTLKLEEHPEMMSPAISDRVLPAISDKSFDFILINYAPMDVAGHSGNFDIAVRSIKAVDAEVKRVVEATLHAGGAAVITSDHGNVERMFDPLTWRAETGHNSSPVPIYVVAEELKGRKFISFGGVGINTIGSLADVSATILDLIQIPKPPEIEGRSLLKELL